MYKIFKSREKRIKTKHIIISHARNTFQKGSYILPDVLEGGTYRYTWGNWQKYYYEELRKERLACHYFIELLDKDYVVFNGLPKTRPSYFLQDLAKAGVIEWKYRDAILILIGEDFSVFPIEDRLNTHMCDKILTPLLYEHHLDYEAVSYIDDLLQPGWKKLLKDNNLKYEIVLQKYYDSNNVFFKMKEYSKK